MSAYIELQVRPRDEFSENLLDCFWLEQWLARREKETRPLWQLLVTTGIMIRISENYNRDRTQFVLMQTLEFLQSDDTIDPGKECAIKIRGLLKELNK